MTDRVIGLLVAKDKEDYIGIVMDSVRGLIDELVFIDDLSADRTAEIVKSRCEHFGIKIHVKEFTAEAPRHRLWSEALDMAKKKAKGKGWFFMVDPDTVVKDAVAIRKMVEQGRDEYWFRSLNLCGDMVQDFVGDLRPTAMHLFRSSMDVDVNDFGCHTRCTSLEDKDSEHFIGWNLSGLQYADHIFQDWQRWFAWVWNRKHDEDWTLSEFIRNFFSRETTGEPSESYMKVFVLNRMRAGCRRPKEVADELELDEAEFREKYMNFPDSIENWDCPFELDLDEDGEIIGRHPDLMATSILEDSQIYQIANLQKYRSWLNG